MAGLEGMITVDYEQLGPMWVIMWPTRVHNRQRPDCTEVLMTHLLKKCAGLFWDEMDKSPESTES
jgi:hypothetical protein